MKAKKKQCKWNGPTLRQRLTNKSIVKQFREQRDFITVKYDPTQIPDIEKDSDFFKNNT